MINGIYSDFCARLLGAKGVYWSDVGPVEQILCGIIYSDYYDQHKPTSREVILRYLAGNSQLSAKIKCHYYDANMRKQLRDNMITLVAKSHSVAKVYRICDNVHNWLMCEYPTINAAIEMEYQYQQLTLNNAAMYLGDVLYHVMLAA